MSKADKLRARFWGEPKPTDFTWKELLSLLKGYGYQEGQGSGSRVNFKNPLDSHRIKLHRPHPRNTLLPVQIQYVRDALLDAGVTE